MNQDNFGWTIVWVVMGFAGLCVTLFWGNIEVYLAERREMKKARFWRLQS